MYGMVEVTGTLLEQTYSGEIEKIKGNQQTEEIMKSPARYT